MCASDSPLLDLTAIESLYGTFAVQGVAFCWELFSPAYFDRLARVWRVLANLVERTWVPPLRRPRTTHITQTLFLALLLILTHIQSISRA